MPWPLVQAYRGGESRFSWMIREEMKAANKTSAQDSFIPLDCHLSSLPVSVGSLHPLGCVDSALFKLFKLTQRKLLFSPPPLLLLGSSLLLSHDFLDCPRSKSSHSFKPSYQNSTFCCSCTLPSKCSNPVHPISKTSARTPNIFLAESN